MEAWFYIRCSRHASGLHVLFFVFLNGDVLVGSCCPHRWRDTFFYVLLIGCRNYASGSCSILCLCCHDLKFWKKKSQFVFCVFIECLSAAWGTSSASSNVPLGLNKYTGLLWMEGQNAKEKVHFKCGQLHVPHCLENSTVIVRLSSGHSPSSNCISCLFHVVTCVMCKCDVLHVEVLSPSVVHTSAGSSTTGTCHKRLHSNHAVTLFHLKDACHCFFPFVCFYGCQHESDDLLPFHSHYVRKKET